MPPQQDLALDQDPFTLMMLVVVAKKKDLPTARMTTILLIAVTSMMQGFAVKVSNGGGSLSK